MRANLGISINLFLAERSWSGLVVADAASQNAKVLTAPRAKLSDLLSRPELQRSGVYVLTGPSEDATFGLDGYIGESDHLAARLRSHAKKKPFWNRAYVAVAKDDWLSKSHIRYLEARLVQQAKRAPLLARVTNEKQDLAYERLTDGDQANVEEFAEFLHLIMPAIGCPIYPFPNQGGIAEWASHLHASPVVRGAEVHFELRKAPARALAYLRDGQFWVCRGSTARVEEKLSLREGYKLARRKMIDQGILIRDPRREVLVFVHDVPFNSPSDAAAVVGTTSLNGRKEWKVVGSGATFDQWEREGEGED
jgi:hypothetical protein